MYATDHAIFRGLELESLFGSRVRLDDVLQFGNVPVAGRESAFRFENACGG